MKSLLLIQFRTDESASLEYKSFIRIASEEGFFNVDAVSGFDSSLNWSQPDILLADYDGVVLGGSGQFNFTGHDSENKNEQFGNAITNVSPLLKYIITHDFPTLGICFGHQMIGHFLGTQTIIDKKQSKAGSHQVSLESSSSNDPLFCDIPNDFHVQYGHTGSLSQLPKDCSLLATGQNCKYGAFKYKKNIYGVQFHPEMNRDDTINKMRLYPEYKKNDPHFESKVESTPYGEKVIVNFARYANNRGS